MSELQAGKVGFAGLRILAQNEIDSTDLEIHFCGALRQSGEFELPRAFLKVSGCRPEISTGLFLSKSQSFLNKFFSLSQRSFLTALTAAHFYKPLTCLRWISRCRPRIQTGWPFLRAQHRREQAACC